MRLSPIAACVLLAACGGGGGSSSPQSAPDEAIGGVWNGIASSDQGNPDQDMIGVSTDDGRFRLLSLDSGGQFVGDFSADGDDLIGSGVGVAPAGFTWSNGATVIEVDFSGQISERSAIAGTWNSPATGESGQLDLQYDDIHARDSARDKFQGMWTSPGGVQLTFNNGDFTGSDGVCDYTGGVFPVNSNFNVYDIEGTISNCAESGTFEGLGVLSDIQSDGTFTTDGAFIYSINTTSIYLTAILDKQ